MKNSKINSLHNPNIDAIKTVAISMIVLVHIANVYERFPSNQIANMIFSSFGYVGVTFFLMLSGYNIYQLLERKKQPYGRYIYGRWKKLSPHYYISLLASLILTASAAYISGSGIMNTVSHLFYFHNLFYSFHGAINGVCWTLGVIFQFYLVAPLLKKAIDRFPILTISLSMVLTILIKAVLFLWLFPENNADSFYYFIYGGQLYTSLDIFLIGMYISKTRNDTVKSNNPVNYLLTALGVVVLCLYILFVSGYGRPYPAGIFTSSKTSVLAFTGLEVIIAFIIVCFNKIRIGDSLCRLISLCSKSQYSLYIWHLIILRVVVKESPVFSYIADRNIYLAFIAAFLFICIVAAIIDVFVSNINVDKVIETFKKFFTNKKLIYVGIAVVLSLGVLWGAKRTYVNISHYSTNIAPDSSYAIYENAVSKIEKAGLSPESGKPSYIYIDKEENGYFNFYRLRYYFIGTATTPDIINNYMYETINGDPDSFMDTIKKYDPDFIIVTNNDLLEENGYKIDSEKGTVFIFDKNSNDIKTFLSEVK